GDWLLARARARHVEWQRSSSAPRHDAPRSRERVHEARDDFSAPFRARTAIDERAAGAGARTGPELECTTFPLGLHSPTHGTVGIRAQAEPSAPLSNPS